VATRSHPSRHKSGAKDGALAGGPFYYAVLAASAIWILLNAALVRSAPKWIGQTAD
jgi:hypothetical protein